MSYWSSDVCSSELRDPAVAVVSSALNGVVSGSSVSNVVSGGIFTIPMMKRTGLSGINAGAIETASDRKSVVSGKSVSVRVSLGGRSIITTKTITLTHILIYYITNTQLSQ